MAWFTMLLVVSTVRAGSRLLTTKLAPTTSACAPASATGQKSVPATIKATAVSRITASTAREALIVDLLRRPARDRARSGEGRIVAWAVLPMGLAQLPCRFDHDRRRVSSVAAGARGTSGTFRTLASGTTAPDLDGPLRRH